MQNAFTLVELLVVVAIIGLLISLLLPAIQAAREYSRRVSCGNNMRQLSLAVLNYHEALKSFPPGNICFPELSEIGCHTLANSEQDIIYCGSIGWPAFILPYLEQNDLYEKIHFDKFAFLPEPSDGSEHTVPNGDAHSVVPHGDPDNRYASENMPPVFACASSRSRALPNTQKDYAVNGAEGLPERSPGHIAVFHCNSATRLGDLARGSTNTFMILEQAHHWWWSPPSLQGAIVEMETGSNPFLWVAHGSQGYALAERLFASNVRLYVINMKDNVWPIGPARGYHPNGINIALCDARVAFVSEKINFDTYWGLFGKDGDPLAQLP